MKRRKILLRGEQKHAQFSEFISAPTIHLAIHQKAQKTVDSSENSLTHRSQAIASIRHDPYLLYLYSHLYPYKH
jgi:hypothetical protein